MDVKAQPDHALFVSFRSHGQVEPLVVAQFIHWENADSGFWFSYFIMLFIYFFIEHTISILHSTVQCALCLVLTCKIFRDDHHRIGLCLEAPYSWSPRTCFGI